MAQKHLRQSEQEALAAALKAHDREVAARDRATEALRGAVKAGVPVLQLARATDIPRMTLLRRLGKVPTTKQSSARNEDQSSGRSTHGGNP